MPSHYSERINNFPYGLTQKDPVKYETNADYFFLPENQRNIISNPAFVLLESNWEKTVHF